MQPDYDDLDDLEEGGFNWMLAMVLLLAVAGFFSLAWYAYQTGAPGENKGDVVVIKADPTPVREAPDNPGGREFPHQEKSIYEAMLPDAREQRRVTLQPEAEKPNIETSQPSADEKVAELLKQAVKEVQQAEAKPKPKPKETTKPFEPVKAEPTPSAAAEPATTGERVQLGAFRSRAEAEKNWQKILRANRSALKGKPHQVIRADLGAKGVFYRLRVAGLSDAEAAKALCKALSQRGQGCFVVR